MCNFFGCTCLKCIKAIKTFENVGKVQESINNSSFLVKIEVTGQLSKWEMYYSLTNLIGDQNKDNSLKNAVENWYKEESDEIHLKIHCSRFE